MLLLTLLLGCAEVTQTPSCADFVACVDARDAADGAETDTLRFEPTGDCWGSPDGQALCDRACSSGLEWLRESYDDLPEACL
jgi:hypothetical protein